MLSVKNLEVCYGAISALLDVSFDIEAGKIVTLIGGNGAGKTTTLRTISGLLRAKRGQHHVQGRRHFQAGAASDRRPRPLPRA